MGAQILRSKISSGHVGKSQLPSWCGGVPNSEQYTLVRNREQLGECLYRDSIPGAPYTTRMQQLHKYR